MGGGRGVVGVPPRDPFVTRGTILGGSAQRRSGLAVLEAGLLPLQRDTGGARPLYPVEDDFFEDRRGREAFRRKSSLLGRPTLSICAPIKLALHLKGAVMNFSRESLPLSSASGRQPPRWELSSVLTRTRLGPSSPGRRPGFSPSRGLPAAPEEPRILVPAGESGGTGRRTGLRILYPPGCGGSSPPSRTKRPSFRGPTKTDEEDQDGPRTPGVLPRPEDSRSRCPP